MAAGSSVRNRSARVTVATPRGRVEVVRQQTRGLRQGSDSAWFSLARRAGHQEWREATTAIEAIRKATLLAPRQRSEWLGTAAAEAEQKIFSA